MLREIGVTRKTLSTKCGLFCKKKKPDDYVIATGKQTTVKNFVNLVAQKLEIKIKWRGKGIKEKALDQQGRILVACDKTYYRPLEVNNLLGNSAKARRILNWRPKISIKELISEMVEKEMNEIDK